MRAMLAMMLVVAWVGTSSGGAIGLYSDSAGTNCSATLAVGGTVYVQVWIEPDAAFRRRRVQGRRDAEQMDLNRVAPRRVNQVRGLAT